MTLSRVARAAICAQIERRKSSTLIDGRDSFHMSSKRAGTDAVVSTIDRLSGISDKLRSQQQQQQQQLFRLLCVRRPLFSLAQSVSIIIIIISRASSAECSSSSGNSQCTKSNTSLPVSCC